MATNTNTSFLCIALTIFFFSISPSLAKTQSSPAIVLQLTKATSSYSSQYVTSINLKTHAIPPKLTIDLGGDNLWVVCGGNNFNVSAYRPVSCNTAECKLADGGCEECYAPPEPGCHRKMCVTNVANRMTDHLLGGELGQYDAFLQSTNGGGVSIPGLLFGCGVGSILEGLANGVVGMAGLGRSNIALPSLISNAFNLPKKFAICLSTSSKSKGVIIFGDKPYAVPRHSDLSVFLLYTPLILNPYRIPGAFQNDSSPEYFINLTSIRINGKDLALNKTRLSINKDGFGGAKFSTIKPYTIMHSSIYNLVKNAFAKELTHLKRVKPVAPFEICYNANNLPKTQVGPSAPFIDFVMHHKDVFWRIYGSNSMVSVKNGEVLCLGFVDGGIYAETSVVIGGHQMENNLLQFDVENSRLGFTSTLLLQQTSCANYNFPSKN